MTIDFTKPVDKSNRVHWEKPQKHQTLGRIITFILLLACFL